MTVTINNIDVTLDAGEVPAFTYELWKLTEPDRITGARSTTFKLPNTRAVARALGGWAVNEIPDAELPVLRVASGTGVIFQGRVVVISRSEEEYELIAVGEQGGWADAAKRTSLQDLNLGETQVLTRSYVVGRWSDESAADAYPLIDYGSFEGRAASYDVPFAKVRPAVRTHRILQRFFSDAGYTLEAKGSLSSLWRKIIIPNSTGRIKVADSYLTGNTTVTRTTAGVTLTVSSGAVNEVIQAGFVSSDPGSNYTASYRYTAPYDMTLRAAVTGVLDADFVNSVAPRWGQIQLYNVTTNTNAIGRFTLPTTSAPFSDFDFSAETNDLEVAVNDVLEVRILLGLSGNGAITSGTLQEAAVTFRPVNIEYQSNIAIEIAPTLPNMKVSDLMLALTNIQNLVWITYEQEKRVEVWRLDDYLKGRESGLDWSGRIDHIEPAQRIQQEVPLRVEFRFEEDDNDRLAREYIEANGIGYGDRDVDIPGGWADPYEVSVKFAATRSTQTLGVLQIPAIYQEDGDYQVDSYKTVPRLLITDGLADGAWVFSGGSETQYPVTYFADPAGSFGKTLSFAADGLSRGVVDSVWAQRIGWMSQGRVLEADLLLSDYEVSTMDFGRPVLIDYGTGRGWFYVVKVDQKRFGVHEPVRCTLIPLV